MRVAFYAPLKSPDHPVPSGDRTIARGLQAALRHGGHSVYPTSSLRIYDKHGDASVQQALLAEAKAEVTRLLASPDAKTWDVWLTYHNYYKAPDLIGPAVCAALGLRYVLVEATRARKRLQGPWAAFAQAAETACDSAATILYPTEHDAEALIRDKPAVQEVTHFPPFLARTSLPEESKRDGPILSIGMMRPGDKLASYALIRESLARLPGDWQIEIVGDGPARPEVEAMMAPFGTRVQLIGALPSNSMEQAYTRASCFFWPGVNEAFGMVYLEAQAAGLPIVAQDRPGVRDVVRAPRACVETGAPALAERLNALLASQSKRDIEGAANRDAIHQSHMLPAAAARLSRALKAS